MSETCRGAKPSNVTASGGTLPWLGEIRPKNRPPLLKTFGLSIMESEASHYSVQVMAA